MHGTGQSIVDSLENKNQQNVTITNLTPSKTWKTTVNTSRGENLIKIDKTFTGTGVLHAITLHTSCSLALLDPEAAKSREASLSKTVPEKWNHEFFEHTYEGPDDMPAHLKCAIQGAETSVFVRNGKILGDENFYLIEHRDHRTTRKVVFRFFELEN